MQNAGQALAVAVGQPVQGQVGGYQEGQTAVVAESQGIEDDGVGPAAVSYVFAPDVIQEEQLHPLNASDVLMDLKLILTIQDHALLVHLDVGAGLDALDTVALLLGALHDHGAQDGETDPLDPTLGKSEHVVLGGLKGLLVAGVDDLEVLQGLLGVAWKYLVQSLSPWKFRLQPWQW